MREIELTQGYIASVDDQDWEKVTGQKWHAHRTPTRNAVYACTKIGGKHVLMHKLLTGNDQTDHQDGNGLNNQRYNLRACSTAQNQAHKGLQSNNISGFKGVCRRGNRWGAFIRVNGNQLYLGTFSSPQEAALRYDDAAVLHFGAFAQTNAALGLL